MGLGQHRNVLPLLGIIVQLLNQLLHHRIVNLLQSLLDRKGNAGVVNVLRCEAEVDELLVALETAHGVELLLDKVLYGFYVVVSNRLNVFHTLCISGCEITVDVTKLIEC